MTQQEHRLIVTMLGRQLEVSMMILEILKSRGVVEGDEEIAAFASLPQAPAVLISRVGDAYQQVARLLGVDANLDDPPHP